MKQKSVEKSVTALAALRKDFGDINHRSIYDDAKTAASLWYEAQKEGKDTMTALALFSDLIARTGLPPSDVQNIQRWFQKAFLRDARQQRDMAAHQMRKIGHDGMLIVSDAVLRSRQLQLATQRQHLDGQELLYVDENGNEVCVPFSEVWNTPERRAAKHYVRVKELERYCQEENMAGFFLTLTLRGEYHPNPSNGRSTWRGFTPKDGHDEMQRRWRSFQKRFGKYFGIRVEEQHLDGCVHWHKLVWIPKERIIEFRTWLIHCFGDAPATKIKRYNPARAKAASYLMKYILKATGSRPLGTDSHVQAVAERADAHRATWGGRAITFFDIPSSSTLWDELRGIRHGTPQYEKLAVIGKGMHEAAWGNDYHRFLRLLSTMKKEGRACHILYEKGSDGSSDGAITGIVVDGIEIHTHDKKWLLRRAKRPVLA